MTADPAPSYVPSVEHATGRIVRREDGLCFLPVYVKECLVGGLNWPLCALGLDNHDECYEATTGHPKRWLEPDIARLRAEEVRVVARAR